MRFAPCFILLMASSAIAPLASAAGAEGGDAQWDLGVKASTLGVGVEVRRSFSPELALRASFSRYSYDLSEEVDDVAYDGQLDLQSGGLIDDWHPMGDGFRVSTGLFLNGTELEVDAEPSGGTFEFDGQTYAAAEVGRAEGTADFNSIAPYLGIGYHGAFGSDSRLSLTFDVGVLFQGEPSFDLEVTCGPAVPTVRCSQLQADVDEERQQFEEDADGIAYYPVLSLGLTYRLGGD